MSSDSNDGGASRRPRVVDSLQKALPGDFVPLGRRGEIMSRRRYRARWALSWLGFALGVFLVGGFWGGLLHSVTAGVVAGGATAAILLRRWRQNREALLRATAELTAGRPFEARAALAPLAGRLTDARSLYLRAYLDFRVDWAMGDRQTALAKCGRLRREHPRNPRLASEHVWLLAVGGLDARTVLEAAPDAPGPTLALGRAGAELRVAFLDDALPAAYDSEHLHTLAREVLQTSLFGAVCILLAWAFEKRGEGGMAAHLLDEAPARLGNTPLASFDPPLAAWFTGRTKSGP